MRMGIFRSKKRVACLKYFVVSRSVACEKRA